MGPLGLISLISLISLILGLACGSPPEEPGLPFEVVAVSEHLCLGVDFAEPVCAANLALLDAQVAYVASTLGIAPPERCIPVFWTPYAAPFCQTQACLREGIIYADLRDLPKWIVHSVLDQAGIGGPWSLREGLAEALSGRPLRSHGLGLAEALGLDGQARPVTDSEQESVGHLVAWMLETFGVDEVLRLARELAPEAGGEEVLDHLAAISGAPRASVIAAYAGVSGRIYAGKGPFACGASLLPGPELQDRWAELVEFECEAGVDLRRVDVVYAQDHISELWRGYRLELPAGRYRFQLGITGHRFATLQACLTEDTEASMLPEPAAPVLRSWDEGRRRGLFPWEGLPTALSEAEGVEMELPAGSYALWLGWVQPAPNIIVPLTATFALERVE